MTTLTVSEAFLRLKSRLEITPEEEELAIKRRGQIHDRLKKDLDLEEDPVLHGSFHRDTKTKPLKDVDFFCPIKRTEENLKKYRNATPRVVLDHFASSLKKRYGDRVSLGRRSVRIEFGSEDNGKILSYDVVPCFRRDDDVFEIPDHDLGRWIASDPRVHAQLATERNKACGGKWKPLVKMMKGWNRLIEDQAGEKAIKPSFLIEVICLDVIDAPIEDYPTELQFAFNTLAEHVGSDWGDPSGHGPNVNEMSAQQRERARKLLLEAGKVAAEARRFARVSDRQALMKWKELFGSLLPVEE
jgi:hypothetical protein